MSTRLTFAVIFWLSFATLASAKPNIVFILADDLGAADLGCTGSTFYKTPHIDALAKAGLRFTHAYSACPVCSPTRAAILTGLYPARIGVTDWLPGAPDRPARKLNRPPLLMQLPLDAITLAERLKTVGYATAHIGKWHLGGDGFGPLQQGFDINIGGNEIGTTLSYFAPYERMIKGERRVMPGLEQTQAGEYLTDRLTLEVEKFIRANADKPFFLYLPHYAVHTPMRAKDELIRKYPNKPTFGKQSNPVYAAMVESLDDSVGRILKVLDELKLTENTIVVFTSDNGGLATLEGMPQPPTFNGPYREGKGYLYEGGIRVPLIMRGPGIKGQGRVDTTPVCSIDFVPTLCELCGVPVTDKLDGESLRTVLAGTGALTPRALYWHYPHYANQGSKPGGAIRDGNYKLIEFFENGRTELFDLKAGEGKNLIEEKPEIARRLADQLARWRRDVGAKMMTPNSDYTPNPQEAEGTITLPARSAEVHGVMLRFEPLPHKNTLGYWVNEKDWASWEFTVSKPGSFDVEILQGCGTGQGGSEVAVTVGDQKFTFIVEDTGGFQAFKRRTIGQITIEKVGRQTLEIRPVKKAKAAVMDVREIQMKPRS